MSLRNGELTHDSDLVRQLGNSRAKLEEGARKLKRRPAGVPPAEASEAARGPAIASRGEQR